MLPGGAAMRIRAPGAPRIALLLGGGVRRPIPDRWSPTMEWLARRIARSGGWTVAELRYQRGGFGDLASCIRDARDALDLLPNDAQVVLVGFSMGGGVATAVAGDPRVTAVIALAPWVPPQISVRALAGKRLVVAHGTLDGKGLGIGVAPRYSAAFAERAARAGARTTRTLVSGGVHGLATRAVGGRLLPLPRAGAWARIVLAALEEAASAAPAEPLHVPSG